MMIMLVLAWATLSSVGNGLIYHPQMGKAIRYSGNEPTPTDFVSSTFAGAASMSIGGGSSFMPHTPAFTVVYMFNSLIGMCMLSLTLTYFMQVYSSLHRRNVAALCTHVSTGGTGDAAELIARHCPQGDCHEMSAKLTEMAAAMADIKEMNHFYSLLVFFRFREAFYAVARLCLVVLDVVTLIETGLDDRRYGKLKRSAALDDLRAATMRLLSGVDQAILPGGVEDEPPIDDSARERWRGRYFAGLRRMREAGIATTADEDAGAERYVSLRSKWDAYIERYARFMDYDVDEIDVAVDLGTHADQQVFPGRLRSTG